HQVRLKCLQQPEAVSQCFPVFRFAVTRDKTRLPTAVLAAVYGVASEQIALAIGRARQEAGTPRRVAGGGNHLDIAENDLTLVEQDIRRLDTGEFVLFADM